MAAPNPHCPRLAPAGSPDSSGREEPQVRDSSGTAHLCHCQRPREHRAGAEAGQLSEHLGNGMNGSSPGGIPTKRPHLGSRATSISFAPEAELCSGTRVGFCLSNICLAAGNMFFVCDNVPVKSSGAGGCRMLQELVLWNKQSSLNSWVLFHSTSKARSVYK